MSSLDSMLTVQEIPSLKAAIAYQLWNGNSSKVNTANLTAYFSFYKKQCDLALHDGGRNVSVRTHREVLEIAKDLRSLDLVEIHRNISAAKPLTSPALKQEAIRGSINLASQLLLMLQIGRLQSGYSPGTVLEWKTGRLKDVVHDHFKTPPALLESHVKLEKIFNALNLVLIAGFKIHWTDNLADHLRLFNDDKEVAIFHHVYFLKLQQENQLYPEGFINETLKTLALLFPQSNKASRKWLRKISTSWHLDKQILLCGSLKADNRQIEQFRYWHDRIVMLKQAFDDATPRTLTQWYYDRRDGVQWYTFAIAVWVLLLTLLFGTIGAIEGAMQVYKAFHPS